jgi:hypothetical protein
VFRPWSRHQTLAGAVQRGEAADELREQYRLMRLKRMLIRYGIHVINVSDVSLARGVVRAVVAHPTAPTADVLRDGLEVVSAYNHLTPLDVYTTRLRYLASAGRLQVSEATAVLDAVSPSTAVPAALEVLGWLYEAVDHAVANDTTAVLADRVRVQQWLEAGCALWTLLQQPLYAAEPTVMARLAPPPRVGAIPAPALWAMQYALVTEVGRAAPWATLQTAAGRRTLFRTLLAAAPPSHSAAAAGVGAERRMGAALAAQSVPRLQRLAAILHLAWTDVLAIQTELAADASDVTAAMTHVQVPGRDGLGSRSGQG